MKTNVAAVFTDDMIKTLSTMKGKTLKAIQGVFDYGLSTTDGNLRLVLGQYALDIECYYHNADFLNQDGDVYVDEFAYFTCGRKKLSETFKPFVNKTPISFMINETISEVVLIRDDISVSNGEHVIMDQALVIKTTEKAYTISRQEWFLVSIDITVSDKIEGFPKIKDVKESWNGEGRYSVDVNREFLFL